MIVLVLRPDDLAAPPALLLMLVAPSPIETTRGYFELTEWETATF